MTIQKEYIAETVSLLDIGYRLNVYAKQGYILRQVLSSQTSDLIMVMERNRKTLDTSPPALVELEEGYRHLETQATARQQFLNQRISVLELFAKTKCVCGPALCAYDCDITCENCSACKVLGWCPCKAPLDTSPPAPLQDEKEEA